MRISNASSKRLALAGLAIALFFSGAAYGGEPSVKPFANGERVTFLGDSITHGGLYHANLQLFWDLRFPGSGTRLMNCGVSGGTAGGAALSPAQQYVLDAWNTEHPEMAMTAKEFLGR